MSHFFMDCWPGQLWLEPFMIRQRTKSLIHETNRYFMGSFSEWQWFVLRPIESQMRILV
jgi:hypothetical protein